jgi:hypothetical protein
MTAVESYREAFSSGRRVGAGAGDAEFSVSGPIVSECDAWLQARPDPILSPEPSRAFWTTAEVEAYFERRRAEEG